MSLSVVMLDVGNFPAGETRSFGSSVPLVGVEVLPTERMAAFAMGLTAVPVTGYATPNVLDVRDGLKVPRVDASAVSTEMVEFQFGGDTASHILVGETVSDNAFSVEVELPVTIVSNPPDPEPAGFRISLGDLAPKPLSVGRFHTRHSRDFMGKAE